MQYTIRQIPRNIDKALRAKAKAEGKSLNQAAVEALRAGLGVVNQPTKKRDLSDLVGTMTPEDSKAMEEVRELFDRVDEDVWR